MSRKKYGPPTKRKQKNDRKWARKAVRREFRAVRKSTANLGWFLVGEKPNRSRRRRKK